MGVQIEKLEHNMVKLTIEVDAKEFDAATKKVYNRQKGQFNLPGFRKGKVPMNVIERTYGAGVFYEDAVNEVMPGAYAAALADNADLAVVSRPDVEVTQVGKGQNLIFTATVAVKPEVTLGDYKGVEVEKEAVEVTDEEIDAELKRAQEQQAREVTVEDRAVKEGDIVTLNYAGTVDGVAFDGGTAENQKLEIGSHSFIDNFEDQLVGLNIGEEKDVEVTFPEVYQEPSLAGKAAVFHCEILGITEKVLPELDDDFAQDTTEFDSLEEYKADVKAKLAENKEAAAKTNMENALVEKIVANAQMDIPDAMIESQLEQMVDEFRQRVASQGIPFDQYLQFTGQTLEAFQEQMRPEALTRIQSSLVLEAVAAAENIEATDEDVDAEIAKMAEMYQMEVEQLKGYMQESERDNMKADIALQKAVDFLVEQAVITEASDDIEFEG